MGQVQRQFEFLECSAREEVGIPHLDSKLSAELGSINLPDDVFEPGEVKPTRPLKKPGTNGVPLQKNMKRPAPSDVCRVIWWIVNYDTRYISYPRHLEELLTQCVGISSVEASTTCGCGLIPPSHIRNPIRSLHDALLCSELTNRSSRRQEVARSCSR
jgi:hypothetical protein